MVPRWGSAALAAVIVLFATLVAGAAEPTRRAFLRLDVDQHIAQIRRLAVDRAETTVVTASDDKTLRVWSAATGELQGVMRVPIDDGWEGTLYAVAVAPDGRTAVAAGNTAFTWDGLGALYVFDLEKRTIRGRLPKQPDVVNHLAYSPDGRFVAVAYGGTAGIRVLDAATFGFVAEDTRYEGLVTSLAFDGQGRLATVAFDGTLRLYAAESFALAAKAKLASKQPTSVAFARDGSRIAVGYGDKRTVDVLSGSDLKALGTPSLDGLDKGFPRTVAWVAGPGGDELVAAGTLTRETGRFAVRRWTERGPVDTVLAADAVNHFVPLADGGFLYATAEPSWGRVDAAGAVAYRRERVTADFRDAQDGRLAVSPDGLTVAFRPDRDGGTAYGFTLLDRELTAVAVSGPVNAAVREAEQVPTPDADAKTLKLENWRNRPDPKLGKKALTLGVGELARSVALLPDGKRFVLGAEHTLRLFDGTGKELRQVELPAAAWSVVAPRRSPFVVAALADGSIRWYDVGGRRAPLAEVLAFFPHRDGRRWVLWTPEGFFDYAQDGGSQFVGFHQNTGVRSVRWMEFARAARVFNASDLVVAKLDPANDPLLRERLDRIGDIGDLMARRPEVRLVEFCTPPAAAEGPTRGLQLGQGAAAPSPPPAPTCTPVLASATRGLSRRPAVAAAADTGGATAPDGQVVPAGIDRVVLRFAIKSPDGHGGIQVRRNERNATDERVTRGLSRQPRAPQPGVTAAGGGSGGGSGLPPPSVTLAADEELHEAVVPLDVGANRIEVHVFEKAGNASQPSNPLVLQRPAPAERPAEPRRLLLFVAGINAYGGDITPLNYARSDAAAFAEMVKANLPEGYDRAASLAAAVELYDDKATKAAIRDGLATLRSIARPQDVVVVYLAGHGEMRAVAPGDPKEGYFFIAADTTALDDDAIRATGLSSAEIVEALSNLATREVLIVLDTCHAGKAIQDGVRKAGEEIGRPSVWAGSTSTQKAIDGFDRTGHGLFYHSIERGLLARASVSDENLIFHAALGAHLKVDVPELSRKIGVVQKPFIYDPADEDREPFALIRRPPAAAGPKP